MDNKVKMFLIKTISQINDDSFKLMDHFGENYFVEKHEKQIKQIEQNSKILPLKIVDHIDSFIYCCGKCNKNNKDNICHLCKNTICTKCDIYDIFYKKRNELYICLDCMIGRCEDIAIMEQFNGYKTITGNFEKVCIACTDYDKIDFIHDESQIIRHMTMTETLSDKRNFKTFKNVCLDFFLGSNR